LILFIHTLALYKSFTYLLTYLLTYCGYWSVHCAIVDGFSGGFVSGTSGGASAWNMASLDAALTADTDADAAKKKSTTAEEFLGQNANLVNLNELIVRPPPSSKSCTSRVVISADSTTTSIE